MIKIFIVDDDESLQRLYGLILREAGFEIIETAINGKEAIEKYNKLEIKPDIKGISSKIEDEIEKIEKKKKDDHPT